MIRIRTLAFKISGALGMAALPLVTYAKSFKDIVDSDIVPFGNTVITLLYSLAFLAFLAGMARLFFSDNAESRQKGKIFALYSIIGLVALFAVWGFVQVMLGVLKSFNT